MRAIDEWRAKAVRSLAHKLENSRNPDRQRAAIDAWLNTLNSLESTPLSVAGRVAYLIKVGLNSMHAFHLAWAEYLGADVLVTTDDRFLSQCAQFVDIIDIRVLNPVSLAVELMI